jgi:hypothetical protein
MERLTYFKDGYWRVNFSGVQYQADFVDRLAAYEDIAELCGGFDRLRELAEADKDGRVVVLPCKVGDTVWIVGAVRKLYSAKVRTFFCGHPSAVRGRDPDGHIHMIRTTECDIPMQEFGKTVFLSREEAEKALQEMEGKG